MRPVGDEVVVYDPANHNAHCLNRTAAIVFRAADGRTSLDRLARLLAPEADRGAARSLVLAALELLGEAQLLERPVHPRPADPSRRRALERVGLGVAALAPLVASLVVPTPAEALNTCIPAASCTTTNPGQPCWTSSQALDCPSKVCTGAVGQCL